MRKKTLVFIMLAGAAVLMTIIGLSVHATSNDDTKELQMVHVIFRHGIRTPADTYPNDPYINHTFSPIGWGQVTNEGKVQLYQIGKYLRKRYGDFLGTHYRPNEYYVQTTDVDRTKMSAQLINAGLWPPKADQKWGPLEWQPIPMNSEPLSTDNLLLVRRPCAQYHHEFDRVVQLPEVKKIYADNKQLFDDLTRITGKSVTSPDDVQDVFSTLRAEAAFNLTLPSWTDNYYPKKMQRMTEFSFVLNAYTDKLNRLKGGVLLKKLIGDWKSKRDGTVKPKERKAFLYGGHDSTVSNLMSTLKVWDQQLPDYGITVLLELLRDKPTNTYGVEVSLRNATDRPPYKMTIPGCAQFCPLDKLIELTVPVVPVDWNNECLSDDPNYKPPPPGGP